MKAVATFIALLCLAANSALAGDKAETLTFKQAGFSIAPLDEPQKGPSQTLIMFLPASDGFAPNVNVQIQPYSGSIDAYADLSKTQFKQVRVRRLQLLQQKAKSVFLM